MNLVHFFMHELAFYFLSKCFRQILEKNKSPEDMLEFSGLSDLRFCHRNNVSLPISPTEDMDLKKKIMFLFFEVLSFLTGHQIPRVYLGKTSFKFKDLIFGILRRGYIPYRFKTGGFYFNSYSLQKDILLKLCADLLHQIQATAQEREQFWYDLDKALDQIQNLMIQNLDVLDRRSQKDVALIGSPAKLHNRFLSFFAAAHTIPVYGCLHGSECGANRAYNWVYNDFTCCDVLLGYGPAGRKLAETARSNFFGELNNSFNYVESSCENVQAVRDLQKNKTVKASLKFQEAKVLYVASRVRGVDCINPATVFSPSVNISFVREILDQFENVDVKSHPKGDMINYGVEDSRIKTGDLKDLLSTYDAVMVDNVASTAFAIMAASELPIIYFKMTDGGATTEGQKQILRRVKYFELDQKHPEIPIDSLNNLRLVRNTSYEFTEKFSLSNSQNENNSRLDKILDLF
ncbi:hypothetical protein N9P15_02455 [Planktomarina sp.]|nr:hypothetical protein [Planktomarina sp.]